MTDPKISIIVPVYNAEKYLNRCLDSIVNQKFIDWECVLIDDGSSDNSGIICDDYAQKDKRFKTIHKRNEGPSIARNEGIKNAIGKYLCFIDSDDWVDSLYLQQLFENAIENEPALIISGFIKEDIKGPSKHEHKEELYTEESFHKMFEERKFCFEGYPFGKLYNKELINNYNIEFNPYVKFSEDLIFNLDYILCVKRIKFISGTAYHYMNDNPSSLIKSYHSFESEYAGYRAYANVTDLLEKKYSMTSSDLLSMKKWLVHFAMRAIKTIYRPGKNYKNSRDRVSILTRSFLDRDKSLFYDIKDYLPLLDKVICTLILSGKIVLLEKILSIFFCLRYNTLLLKIRSFFTKTYRGGMLYMYCF